jgi:hypothetical protein
VHVASGLIFAIVPFVVFTITVFSKLLVPEYAGVLHVIKVDVEVKILQGILLIKTSF